MRHPQLNYTGIRATDQEEEAMQSAMNTPLMFVGGHWPKPPMEVIHEIALQHNLPEIVGYHGYDFMEHEFVTCQ